MRTIKLKAHFTKEEILQNIENEKNIRFFKELQIINCILNHPNETAETIASFLSCNKRAVYEAVKKYNHLGRVWQTVSQWGGRRKENEYMTKDEESKLFKELENNALEGKILTYKDVKKIVEEKLKKEVSDDYIWLLFRRNEWVKNQPRPYHPQRNIEEQEEFKKNFKRIWMPKK
jgi:hypothetical protein